jgi:hypothetical protein
VTKPVEKFEVVLGRFLGYAGLLTIGLFLVSLLSLVYIVRGVNEESAKESYKARVPIYGHLRFAGTKKEEEADSVGREWSYRTYITGPTYTRREPLRQFAVWDFYEVPADVLNQEEDIVFEFGFDIFRLSKGIETAKGVNCTFTFVNARDSTFFTSDNISAQGQHLDRHMTELIQAKPKEVLKTHRMVMVKAVPVTDYHTQSDVSIPADAFREMMGDGKPRVEADGTAVPALRVFVSVDVATEAQMVGVARGDFYLLSGVRDFWQNFLKGVVGMWCTHMLVLGVAVACSTYLSSVISLLGTMFLFVAGLFGDYLRDIAEGRVEGGGPLEAGLRLGTRTPLAKPFEASPTMSLVQSIDTAFSWWVGRIMNLIPDVTRHDLHPYVANGFDIGWFDVILLDNFLPLIGYLAPWAIAAYYLMKYREIANPQ